MVQIAPIEMKMNRAAAVAGAGPYGLDDRRDRMGRAEAGRWTVNCNGEREGRFQEYTVSLLKNIVIIEHRCKEKNRDSPDLLPY